MSSQQTILDGGTLCVLPAIPTVEKQIVYLDFDGENTRYDNVELGISLDDVIVEDSGITTERRQRIADMLNELYAELQVEFTLERLETGKYSTVYVGHTDDFDAHGSFLGLAETIDKENQIKDDNAFVLANAFWTDEAIVDVIAHEVDHIVKGTTHQGEGIDAYGAITFTISSGVVRNNLVVSNYSAVAVLGTVNGASVNSLGELHISSGGVANSTTVNSMGWLWISSGGVANSTTVSGYLFIYSGGVANSTTVNSMGSMFISSGGVANSTTVNSVGRMWISSGGVANSTTVNHWGVLNISRGGVANSTTVNSGGYLPISSGGVANSTTVNSSGYLYISSGGVANSTTVNSGGYLDISSGGVANSTTVNSGGYLRISSGGTATGIVVSEGGKLGITVASNTYIQGISKGSAFVMKGATINNYKITARGHMGISSGGVANSTTVNSGGYLDISSGGVANSTTVNSGGYMKIYSGGVANSTTLNSGGRLGISRGCVANSTTVNSMGSMFISSGGVANSTTVNSRGDLFISSGGVAKDLYLKTGGMLGGFSFDEDKYFAHIDGSAEISHNVSIIGRLMDVSSGGVANSTTVNSMGSMFISNGGVANSTTVNSSGELYIFSGGMANSTTVNSMGSMFISNGGVANSTTVNSRGSMFISSGGVANSTTVNSGGRLRISSGGVANSTTVNSGGSLNIFSGGRHEGHLEIADGATVSAYTGAVIDFTVADVCPGDDYLINDLSLITGTPGYTVTVSAEQTMGTYALAGGVSTFDSLITVQNTDGVYYGNIEVGQFVVNGGIEYALELDGEVLSLQIGDVAAPTISSVSMSQDMNSYILTATVSAADNVTEASDLSYQIKYSMSLDGLADAEALAGLIFELTAESTGQTCHYQVGVSDASGNVDWSGVQTFVVLDGTAPTLAGVPRASVDGRNVTLDWDAASDNVSVAGYILTVDGKQYETSGTSYVLENLSEGTHTYTLSAFDARGNESAPSDLMSFSIADTTQPVLSNVSLAQSEDDYTFTASVTATDNVTAESDLAYCIRYASSPMDVMNAAATPGLSFAVDEDSIGSTYYYQVGVSDEAGNTAWSYVQSITVKDATCPTLHDICLVQGTGNYVLSVSGTASDNITESAELEYQILYAESLSGVTNASPMFGKTISLGISAAGKTYYYQIGVTDEAGNTAWSDTEALVVRDVTLPTISRVGISQAADDYAFNADVAAKDNLTEIHELSYKIKYAVSEAGLAEAEAVSGTSFVLDMDAVGDTYYCQVGVVDGSGNTAWSEVQSIVVKDVTVPTLYSASLSQGDGNYILTASVIATDNATASEDLACQIRYAASAAELEEADVMSGDVLELGSEHAGMTLYYQIGVTDEAGNTTWSYVQNVQVKDFTAPVLNGTPRVAVSGVNTTFTWDAAVDNVGVKGYYLILDGVRHAVQGTALSIDDLGYGQHTYSLAAYDAAGNVSDATEEMTFILRDPFADTTAPVVSSVTAEQGADDYVITAIVSATDNDTPANKLVYQIKYASSEEGLADATVHRGVSFTLDSNDACKTYYYQVSVRDIAFNTTWSDVQSITVRDATAPVLNGAPAVAVNRQNVTISWSSANDNIAVEGYYLVVDGVSYTTSGSSYSLSDLFIGEHSYSLSAYDAAGNRSESFNGTFVIVDSVKPVISTVSIVQGNMDYTFTASVKATDNETDGSDLSYLIKHAATRAELAEAEATSGLTFTLTEKEACTTCYFQVGVVDEAGNIAWSDAQGFTVKDVTAPVLNGVPSVHVNGQDVTLTWSAASDNVAVKGYYVTVDGVRHTAYGTTLELENLAVGNHTYTLAAFDEAGNVSKKTDSLGFVAKDITPPAISNVKITQGTGSYKFTASFSAIDNVTHSSLLSYKIRYSTDEEELASAAPVDGTSFVLDSSAVGDSYYYQVGVADKAGNMTWSSVQSVVVKDATAPVLNGLPDVSVNGFSVSFSWNEANDNVGVEGYYLTVSGKRYATDKTHYTLDSMAPGTYVYTLEAYDAAGNRSGVSQQKTFTIVDDEAPEISSFGLSQSANGYVFTATVSATDNWTTEGKFGYKIKYADSVSALSGATVRTGRSFTLDSRTAGDVKYYQVGVVDEAGNTRWSEARSFTVKDVTSPEIDTISLTQGTRNYTFTASVSATDNKDSASELSYKIKYASSERNLNNAYVSTGTSFELSKYAAGETYYYQVGVIDNAGNATWSEARSFIVKDVTAPTLNGTPSAHVSGQSVTISWSSASDNLGIAGYYLTVDGKQYDVKDTRHTISNLSPGTYSYTIAAYDAAKNVSSKSASKSFTISEAADTTKPEINSFDISQGASSYRFTVTVSASDNKTSSRNLSYMVKYATSSSALNNATAMTGKSFTLSSDAAGKTYWYKVAVTDEAGNIRWSNAESFTVEDVTAPTLNGKPSADVDGQSVTISWKPATDNVEVAGYYLTVDDQKYTIRGKTSYKLDNVSAGEHSYVLAAFDAEGNVSGQSTKQTFTVEDGVDRTEPEILSVSLSQGTDDYTFSAQVSAKDNETASWNLEYKIKYSSSKNGWNNEFLVPVVSGTSFTLDDTKVGKTYYYQVGVTDEAGNTAWSRMESIVVKDVTDPVLAGIPRWEIVNGGGIKFSWDAATDNVRVSNYCLTVNGWKYDVGLKTSYTVPNLGSGNHTFTISAEDAAGNVSTSPVCTTSSFNVGLRGVIQNKDSYTFTADPYTWTYATDVYNPGASINLTWNIKYATSEYALNNAKPSYDLNFSLDPSDAGKTYYCQVSATDSSGSTVWSNVVTFVVKDVTDPTFTNSPKAQVNDDSVTIFWNVTDNVGVTECCLTIDDKEYNVTGKTKYTIDNLSPGKHSFTVTAIDKAGNKSEKTSSFSIAAPGSTFKWSGTEDVYVQENGVTKSDFKWTKTNAGESGYMWTASDIVDAEKSSETTSDYYLYLNTCWAATASNMFVRAGWDEGIAKFDSEDSILEYVTEEFSFVPIVDKWGRVVGTGVGGGQARCGLEWLFKGYQTYWPATWSSPNSQYSGGFYKDVSLGNYFSEEIILREYGKIKWFGNYELGTGFTYERKAYTSEKMLSNAFEQLKEGAAVGMSVSWHSNSSLSERAGGHAITVYGFTYDESKKGTPGYFTGVVIADSDDDFARQGKDVSLYPNRIKIMDIEYNPVYGVYVFSNNNGYGKAYGVIDGFQYLKQRPEDITGTLDSRVVFAKNADWNAAYSVGTNDNNVLEGTKPRIHSNDDVYIAVNLQNYGLGDSDEFVVKIVIDGDESNAQEVHFNNSLSYSEKDDFVLNIGKLDEGYRKIELLVLDGEYTDTITIDDLYVAYSGQVSDLVTAGTVNEDLELSFGNSLVVMENGQAVGTNVRGELYIEYGGMASDAEIHENGVLFVNGNVSDVTVHAGGMIYAEQYASISNAIIETEGFMNVNYRGQADETDVYGELTVTNGRVSDTTVFENGVFIVENTGVSDFAEVLDSGVQRVMNGGTASNNTFGNASQRVSGMGSVARMNTFDGGMQIVVSGGAVYDSQFYNGGYQDVSEGSATFNTELFSGSTQYLWRATAYSTTVNAGCMSWVFEESISIDCTVKSGGHIVVGDMDGMYERGAGSVKNLVVERGGYAKLEEGAVLSGITTIAGTLTVTGEVVGGFINAQDASPSIHFDFTERSVEDSFIVNDISLLKDLDYRIVFSSDQANGEFKFSGIGSDDFHETISVYDDEGIYYGALTLNDMVLMDDQIVTLENVGGALNLVVADSPYSAFEIPEAHIQTNDSSCSWRPVAKSEAYIVQFSRDNFQTFVSVEMTENAVTLNNLPYDLQWRVKARESDVWTHGETINANVEAGSNFVYASKGWEYDVLFTTASGAWEVGYCALHHGILESWGGTKDFVELAGKNKLADIFEGSSDANILLMTDDANGDALFVDDIYTALPGTVAEQQARIAKIDEIRAGAGDDIVDMTSQQFAYDGDGVTIYGGLGDDTIWANNGNNTLFGDAGNDRIVGGSGDDVIVGGAGNDTMHGGGGNDVFTFGGDFGNDEVEQLAGGKVTLWFEEGDAGKWDAESLTYSDGVNSVRVSGIDADDVTLKFGDVDTAVAGAFLDAASEKIFEDKDKGMLA